MYKLEQLQKDVNDTETLRNGKWVPARPVPYYGKDGLKQRIKDAWAVLRGKADAFTWPEGQ